MTEAEKLLAAIAEKDKERSYLLQQLALWVKVQAQGIPCDDVESFGFSAEYLTNDQKLAWRRHCSRSFSLPGNVHDYYREKTREGGDRILVYNYVRMKNDEVRLLNPMLSVPRKVD